MSDGLNRKEYADFVNMMKRKAEQTDMPASPQKMDLDMKKVESLVGTIQDKLQKGKSLR